MAVERFSIDVPQEVLDDLQSRLARTRWPDAVADDWDRGTAPGFGFSERPSVPGVDPERIADLLAGLMSALGLERFAVHGGDVGSGVGEQLALRHRERVVALHLTDVPYWHLFATDEAQLSDAERAYQAEGMAWSQTEGAYAQLQSTKPQTLAYALNDSPAGLAGWFLEKFRAWSDCDDDVNGCFGVDTLPTNLTLYWVTETAGSAARVYSDTMAAMRIRSGDQRSFLATVDRS
jgi:pimeloyl-ACP methyl ester carboxylesterase